MIGHMTIITPAQPLQSDTFLASVLAVRAVRNYKISIS